MKNKIFTVVAVFMAMLLTFSAMNAGNISSANSTPNDSTRIVTVSGEGKIVVTPDVAYIDLGVQTKNVDAQKAQQDNAKLMTAVIDSIKKSGIKAEDIKTTGYNIYQAYDYKPTGEIENEHYVVSNTVNVKIKNINDVGKIIDNATAAGANTVHSIRFTVEDDSKYYAEALKLAMKNANTKATAIMSTFNKKPGLPISVSEASYGGGIYYDYAPARAMLEKAETPIQAGDITITANVTVGYDY